MSGSRCDGNGRRHCDSHQQYHVNQASILQIDEHLASGLQHFVTPEPRSADHLLFAVQTDADHQKCPAFFDLVVFILQFNDRGVDEHAQPIGDHWPVHQEAKSFSQLLPN